MPAGRRSLTPGVVLAVTDHDRAGGGGITGGAGLAGGGGVAGGDLAGSPVVLADASRAVIDWARARSLGPVSACGISVALAACAAVWLTAGTRVGNLWAATGLFASYLALLAARSLALGPGGGGDGALRAGPAEMLPRARWLTALSWSLAECGIYAGLAVGAAVDHWSGMWILAIGVLTMVAVRELMTASSWPPGQEDQDRGLFRWVTDQIMRMPAGGRVLLIGLVAPIWGGRAVLLALLDWTIIAVGLGLASRQGPAEERPAPVQPPAAAGPQPPPTSLAVLLLPASEETLGSGEALATGDALASGEPLDEAEPGQDPAQTPGNGVAVPAPAGPGRAGSRVAAVSSAASQAWRDKLIMLRDDGVLARNLGVLVRGNFLPLPPAILGLAATAMLAYLGLRSLPGILVLSPCLIMLLAAPGSSNRHAGRLDWLVPAVLLGWQCLYLTVVGQAQRVPTPVTFALCAVLLIRYADLACADRPVLMARPKRHNWTMELIEANRERGTALGWEGRMLLMGAAAAAGIGTLAYLALTAYLGLLICAKVLTTCLRLREGDSR
jgi:hypothetical protein